MSQINFRDIQTEVRRRIQTRAWKPGQIIPTEVELAAEFGCARTTINRALRELAETGLLDRRRKAGTRVSLNPTRKATLDIPVTRLEIEARGMTYRHKVLSSDQMAAPDHLVACMNLPHAGQVLHLKCLHLADDRPYLFEDRWVNIAAAPNILSAPLANISANEWLVQNTPISGGDITFLAQNASDEQAAALGAQIGTALFVIERLTWANKSAVTFVTLAYAPGYRMTTQI